MTAVSSSPSSTFRRRTVAAFLRLSCRCSRPPRVTAPSSSTGGTAGARPPRRERSRPAAGGLASAGGIAFQRQPLAGRSLGGLGRDSFLLVLADMLGERLRARLAGADGVGGKSDVGLLRGGLGRLRPRRQSRRRRQRRQFDRRASSPLLRLLPSLCALIRSFSFSLSLSLSRSFSLFLSPSSRSRSFSRVLFRLLLGFLFRLLPRSRLPAWRRRPPGELPPASSSARQASRAWEEGRELCWNDRSPGANVVFAAEGRGGAAASDTACRRGRSRPAGPPCRR